jgi:hypothetical protein
MPMQNTFYNTVTSMHMVERPNRPLPFWKRWLSLNLTCVNRRLARDSMRGGEDLCDMGGSGLQVRLATQKQGQRPS